MERLTEFWDKEDKYISDVTLSDYTDDNGLFPISEEGVDKVIQKLGEYEELEEQGRLVKLPCKVGSTVYHVVQGRIVEVSNVNLFFLLLSVVENRFNNSVFLTKSEAEVKLKELRGVE